MPNCREVRRICGFLSVRQSRLHFDWVPDHRDRRGRRWKLDTLLFSTLLGVMTGQKKMPLQTGRSWLARGTPIEAGLKGRLRLARESAVEWLRELL